MRRLALSGRSELIVPWGAGGGTGRHGAYRCLAFGKALGQPINVVNRTGGSGVVGHSAIAEAAPDGYTLGIATVEIGMMHWQGLTRSSPPRATRRSRWSTKDYRRGDGAGGRRMGRYRRSDRGHQGKSPESSRPRGTGQGGIWHLAVAGMLKGHGIDPAAVPWVPTKAPLPGLQDLVAGGVDVVPVSLPEARSLIDGGR